MPGSSLERPNAGKDWRPERDDRYEMAGWHFWFNKEGMHLGQAHRRLWRGQGNLVCCIFVGFANSWTWLKVAEWWQQALCQLCENFFRLYCMFLSLRTYLPINIVHVLPILLIKPWRPLTFVNMFLDYLYYNMNISVTSIDMLPIKEYLYGNLYLSTHGKERVYI